MNNIKKIDADFIINQYEAGVNSYKDLTIDLGLWESEKYVFDKYLKKDDTILDIGCGTGRTTFALYQKGYTSIVGIDLTQGMIDVANSLNSHFASNISFSVENACNLSFNDERFDSAIFSFNGIMTIPSAENRKKAMHEIYRVLKPNGIFIFTTYDRDLDSHFFEFWKNQKTIWDNGEQNLELIEFGDIITTSKNEPGEIFIHIPNRNEIESLLIESGFIFIETFYRKDLFNEPDAVKLKSGECSFWIVQKN